MANDYINGTSRILFIKWDDEFLPIGCLSSDSFNETSETIDTTTRDNEGWKTSVPTNQSYDISFEGLVINTNFNGGDFGKISLDRLEVLKRDRILIEWKSQDEKLTFIRTGFGHIMNLSDSAPLDEFITFTGTIQGYGKPVSSSAQQFFINDGNENLVQDGNDNLITTA